MKTFGRYLLAFFFLSLSACATQKPMPLPPPKTLSAIGYGTVNRDQQYRLTPAQRKLAAIRASRMDAMRALAEQIYGVRLHGTTTVEDMTVKNDHYRAYVDAVLRGARVKTVTSTDRDTYETTMEVDLTPAFYTCLMGRGSCTDASPPISTNSSVVGPLSYAGSTSHDCPGGDCYTYPRTRGFDTPDQY